MNTTGAIPLGGRGGRGRRSRIGGPGLPGRAFTLLELLVVISIIGLLAAMTAPVLRHFKPNYSASATKQLMDDLARARQLAISQRTTVAMVFVPTNFWNDTAAKAVWRPADFNAASNLYDKQLVGYTFVSLRSMGDQPGSPTPRYLSPWRVLPPGAFPAIEKFSWPYSGPGNLGTQQPALIIQTNGPDMVPRNAYPLYGFDRSMQIPFPLADTPSYSYMGRFQAWVSVPYIAFDYLGRRCDATGTVIPQPAYVPVANGSIVFSRDPVTKVALERLPSITETPPGNATNSTSYNVVCVDFLTGRAHIEHQEVR